MYPILFKRYGQRLSLLIYIVLFPDLVYAHLLPTQYYPQNVGLVLLQTGVLVGLWLLSWKPQFGISPSIKYLTFIWLIFLVGLTLLEGSFIGWIGSFGTLLSSLYILFLLISFWLSVKKKKPETRLWITTLGYGSILLVFGFTLAYTYTHNPVITCTRWRIEKSKQDLETLAKSLALYYADHHTYPPGDPYLPFEYSKDTYFHIPHILTTPVAYLEILPHDPCNRNGKGFYEYGCGTTRSGKWYYIVTAYGNDVMSSIDERQYNPDLPEWNKDSIQSSGMTYDPTNGITSLGDIWRVSK